MDLDEPWAHGGCVFPQPERVSYQDNSPKGGLSLRQYYAGLAMQGCLANQWWSSPRNQKDSARLFVEWADELIKALADTK